MEPGRAILSGLTLTACLGLVSTPLGAQVAIGISAGPMRYSLNSSATGIAAAVYSRHSLSRSLAYTIAGHEVIHSSSVDVPPFQYHTTDMVVFPEMRLELSGRLGPVSPFVGGGAGVAIKIEGHEFGGGSLHATSGIRIRVRGRYSLAGAVTLRSVRPFRGHTAEFQIGLEWLERPRKKKPA